MPDESFLLKRARTRVVHGMFPVVVLCAASAASVSCGSDDFCSQGSYECSGSTPPGGSSATGSGGSAGATTGGATGQGGSGNGAGSPATGGLGGDATSGQGGLAGTATGGTATGGSTGNSSAGEGGEAGSGNPGVCDPASPVDGCTLPAGRSGIYVAPADHQGDDGNDGSPSAPVLTLTHAIELASADQLPIFVCSGTYDEHVEIATGGLAIYGSYACDNSSWTYTKNKPSRIAPSANTEALYVHGVHGGLQVFDLELASANATDPGASSVAVFVSVTDSVTFTRVHVIAGDGADGADGERDEYAYPDPSLLDGNNAMGNTPGAAQDSCPVCDGAVTMTSGGNGGLAQQQGTPGEPQSYGGGAGGTVNATTCSVGDPGADAPGGSDGLGASKNGSLTSEGWTPSSGEAGGAGQPGQGGGGGAGAAKSNDGAGGGGACGGCGGKAGQGGTGGGASIAILSLGSSIAVVDSTAETGIAGNGGGGHRGQDGQGGGSRGLHTKNGCPGGNGGTGGTGGPGGGGAGGISVGIVSTGSTVVVSPDTRITPGTAGSGGHGAGTKNDGTSGISASTLEV